MSFYGNKDSFSPRNISTEAIVTRWARALREYVGPQKGLSVDDLSEETGITTTTIESYRRGETVPKLDKFLQIVATCPPALLNRVIEIAGKTGAKDVGGGGICSLLINSTANKFTALIARHLEDGRVDHMELAEQVKEARNLRDELDRFIQENE